MALGLTSKARAAMIAHAQEEHPREACGILLGRENSIETALACKNVHRDPHRHFEIDPQALISAHRGQRSGGQEVLGYYHSHPNGRREPSLSDRQAAAGDGRVWAIVAEGMITFWRDEPEDFKPVEAGTIDG